MPMTYPPSDASPNRRRGLRLAQMRPVKLHEPASNRYIAGHTADISSTGLRLQLPASSPVRPGTLLSLLLADPSSPLVSRRSMTPARVVWTRRSPSHLTAGLEFLAASAAADAA